MTEDADQEDYKAGAYFVFNDDLGLADQIKHLIETSTLDMLPNDITTFASSASDCALTAVKKRKPSGEPYVLVRKATDDERRALYGTGEGEDEE